MAKWQESDLAKRSVIAQQQLKEWQKIAQDWPVYLENTHIQHPYRCAVCEQCIYFSRDTDGNNFQYTADEELALIVAHVRQVHDGSQR